MKLKALFITRNYPPQTGGLEVYSYNLIREFETHDIIYKIVLTKSIAHLVWFLPYSFFKALYFVRKYSIESIHLCDGLLALMGVMLKQLTAARVSVSIHGLDVTYPGTLYQWVIPRCVSQLDQVICVSRSTRDECVRRGIPEEKCTVIPNGIRPEEFQPVSHGKNLRRQLEQLLGTSLRSRHLLLSVGRLVKRKGLTWFIGNVMHLLDTSYFYLIVGDGPESGHIRKVIRCHNLEDRVFMLGRIPDKDKTIVYNASDIFIMPNITIPGDVEGFGIAGIEAGSCGLPVVGSNIQGIRDAVFNGKTGYLVEECDVNGYLNKIRNMDLKSSDIRSIVTSNYNWTRIYHQYHQVLIRLQRREKSINSI